MNNAVYFTGRFLKNFWRGFNYIMSFMRVRGIKRFFIEIVSDGLTLLFVGLIGFFMLGQYALIDVGEGWQLYQKYSVTFYDKNNNLIGRRGVRHDSNVPLEELPENMLLAALATEDRNFFSHVGVDPRGIARALIHNIQKTSGNNHGASTITQQLAKMLFFSPEQTLERKIKEAYMALWLEVNLTKQEILSLYFDRTYMGAGNFGLEAAAQYYFGKSVREVSLAQAAMLAGLFKAPSNYAPHINLGAARGRANVVLNNMVNAGFLTHGDVFDARANPASVVNRHNPENKGEYFIDWAFEETKKIANNRDYILHVKTTIDLDLQAAARQAIQDNLRQSGEKYNVDQASLVSMEHDGAVLALIGGKDYRKSQFNRAVNAARQPGSSFKPLVYLAALNYGYKPNSSVIDSRVRIKKWSPKNYNRRYIGRTTLNNALVHSINSIPVKLALEIGYKNVISTAKSLGIDAKLTANASLPLGTASISVLDLTGAYATIANGGTLAQPYGIYEIRNGTGNVIYSHDRDEFAANVVANPHKIADLKYMLGNVVEYGTGRRANLNFTKTYGKTGTTQSYRDAWFMGFTDHLVTGVWYGNDNYTPTKRLTGGNLPAITFKTFMTNAYVAKYNLDLDSLEHNAMANLATPRNAILTATAGVKNPTIFIQSTAKMLKNASRQNNIITLSSTGKKSADVNNDYVTLNGKKINTGFKITKPLKRPQLKTIKKTSQKIVVRKKVVKKKTTKRSNIHIQKSNKIKQVSPHKGNSAFIDVSGRIVILGN
ncbi:MAG: PBP1A family penicillin-binding protein [Alphaproteobacteria bacterium]|nr:PBP1A family penicillin-binding protein [Alphaproteobacteria bacterium]